jgi:hypothetical protein
MKLAARVRHLTAAITGRVQSVAVDDGAKVAANALLIELERDTVAVGEEFDVFAFVEGADDLAETGRGGARHSPLPPGEGSGVRGPKLAIA